MSASDADFNSDDIDDLLSSAEDAPQKNHSGLPEEIVHTGSTNRRRRSMFFPGTAQRQPAESALPNSPAASASAEEKPPQRRRGGMFTSHLHRERDKKSPQEEQTSSPAGTSVKPTEGGQSLNRPDPSIDNEPANPAAPSLMRLTCECGYRMRLKPSKAGQKIRCPKCERPLIVPGGNENAEKPKARKAVSFSEYLKRQIAEWESQLEATPPSARKRTLNFLAFRSLNAAVQAYRDKRGELQKTERAVEELGESKDPRAFAVLADLQRDVPGQLQSTVLSAIGRLGDLRGLVFLAKRLQDPLPETRLYAVQGLGCSEDPRAVKLLLRFGLHEPSARFAVRDAILKIGRPAVAALLEILESDNDTDLKPDAIVLLGRLKSERAAKPLVELLASGRAPELRGPIAEALGLIGDERSLSAVIPLLKDPDDRVRAQAAATLSRIPHAQSLRALLQGLQDPHEDVRKRCAAALGDIGDPRAGSALIALLNDPHQETRIAAAEALGRIGDDRAVPALISMLADEDESVVQKAILALRKIQDPQSTRPLLQLLQHPSHRVRQKAAESLGAIGDAVVAEQLEPLLKHDRSEEVRAAAAKALGAIRDPGSVDALLNAVHDLMSVRTKAVAALGEIGDEAAVPMLLTLLRDPIEEMRYHAALALAEINSEASVAPIKDLLGDRSAMVRRGAAKALEKLGEGDAETLMKTTASRRLTRSGQEAAGALMSLIPDGLVGMILGGSVLQRCIVGGILLVPLLAVAGYFLLSPSGPGAASQGLVLRGKVSSLDVSPDGNRILVGRTAGLIEVYDRRSKKRTASWHNVDDVSNVSGAVFTGNAKTVVAAFSQTAGGFDMDGTPTWPIQGHSGQFVQLRISKDRKTLMARSNDGVVSFWTLPSGKPIGAGALQIPRDQLNVAALSPDATLIAGAGNTGRITIWSTGDASVVMELTEMEGRKQVGVVAIAFSPDGKQIAAVSSAADLGIWNLDDGKQTHASVLEPAGRYSNLTYNKDGDLLYAIYRGTSVAAFHLDDKTLENHKIPGSSLLNTIAISDDDSLLVAGGEDTTEVWMFDLKAKKVVGTLDVRE